MKSKTRFGDLTHLSADQLQDELVSLKKEQFNLRFQRATGQLENTARIRIIRRDIARIKTLQTRAKVAVKPAVAPVAAAPATAGA